MASSDFLQGYNAQGQPTGTPLSRPDAAAGALHGASHIWFWRTTENSMEILLQRRAGDKPTWPDFLDISAAGHIDFGEHPMTAALREAHEELGLTILETDLELLFVGRSRKTDTGTSGIVENEFQWVYGYQFDGSQTLSFSDGEVAEVLWVSAENFEKLTKGEMTGEKIVPHGDAYFSMLHEGIQRMIEEHS